MSFINWGSETPEQKELRRKLEEHALIQQAMTKKIFEQRAAAPASAASAAGSGLPISTVYYLRATSSAEEGGNSEPWNRSDNAYEMQAVFGTGWKTALFETLSPLTVFRPATTYVFIDGSDLGAISFDNFYQTNYDIIQNWVFNGGKLFVNAAPNDGGNIDLGFGGIVLNFGGENNTGTDDAVITPGAEEHPIFAGPGECGSTWSGQAFAHAYISGDATGLIESSSLITSPPAQVLVELEWGQGTVIFGGLTLPSFHEPLQYAINLRQNIHSYLSGASYVPEELLISPFRMIEDPQSSRRSK